MQRELLVLTAAAAFVLMPAAGSAQCSGDNCAVGAFGAGGENSAGKAQGFRVVTPSTVFPGGTITNTGNADAGRLDVNDGSGSVGMNSGTFRLNPEPSVRGHGTGLFGEWSGQCSLEDIFDNC